MEKKKAVSVVGFKEKMQAFAVRIAPAAGSACWRAASTSARSTESRTRSCCRPTAAGTDPVEGDAAESGPGRGPAGRPDPPAPVLPITGNAPAAPAGPSRTEPQGCPPRSPGVPSAVRLRPRHRGPRGGGPPRSRTNRSGCPGGPLFGPCAPRTLFAWDGAGVARAPARAGGRPARLGAAGLHQRPPRPSAAASPSSKPASSTPTSTARATATPPRTPCCGSACWPTGSNCGSAGTAVWEDGPDGPARGVEGRRRRGEARPGRTVRAAAGTGLHHDP